MSAGDLWAARARRRDTLGVRLAGATGGESPREEQQRESAPAFRVWHALALLVLLALAVAVLDYGVPPPPLENGDRAPFDLSARVTFYHEDSKWLEEQRAAREKATPPVYRQKANWVPQVLKDLRLICQKVETAATRDVALAECFEQRQYQQLVEDLYEYVHAAPPVAPPAAVAPILTGDLLPALETALQKLEGRGVLSDEAYDKEWEEARRQPAREPGLPAGPVITILGPGGTRSQEPTRRPLQRNKVLEELSILLATLKPGGRPLPDKVRGELHDYFAGRLEASLEYDAEATQRERTQARQAVREGPRPIGKGELLVPKDSKVTRETLQLLHEEARAFRASRPWLEGIPRLLGWTGVSAVVICLLALGFRRLHERRLRGHTGLAGLALTCLAVLVAAKALILNGLPVQLTPVCVASVAASLAFSPGVGFLTALSLAVLTGCLAGGDLGLALALLAGGAAAARPAERIRRRWDLILCGLRGGLVQALTIAVFSQLGLQDHWGWGGAYPGLAAPFASPSDALWGLLNGLLCALLLLGLLPVLEHLLGMVTAVHLMELCDPNRPGLLKLMLEAPGTWAHTLQVAALSEQAAEAIGANAPLIRAGVYYHDLGKTVKPEYFVENQFGAEELHKRLSPSLSALVVLSHVKDGMELARRYRLPHQVAEFIPEHHGTSLVTYFYHDARQKALAEKAAGRGDGTVPEAFFRYPGPKPQSRETAIVMLADSVEAATRTLISPSSARARAFIHDLILKKLLDGQLDESDLTFRDLSAIEDTFLRIIVSRVHTRIAYPGQEEAKPAANAEPHAAEGKP